MIGFATTEETAAMFTDAIRLAQTSRGLEPYWILEGVPITRGVHAGKMFLPCDDSVIHAPLHQGTQPHDYPEFSELVTALGGLDARVEIDPVEIAQPFIEP